MMTTPKRQPRSFSMPLALGISGVLHAILLLISLWLPVGRQLAAAERPQESEIKFTFAQPTEEADLDGRIQGDVPVELPELPQEGAETQLPPVEAEPQPDAAASLQAPSAPGLPVPSTPILPELREESPLDELHPEDRQEIVDETLPVDEPEPVEEPERTADEILAEQLRRADDPVETGSALPLDDAGEFLNVPESEPVPPVETDPSLNVEGALREFERRLRQWQASRPRPPAAGGEPRNTFHPPPQEVPSTGFGVGNLVFESSDYDWTDYARQIYWAIWSAWHNRLYESVDDFERWSHSSGNWMLNHQTAVRFVIESSGQVTGIAIETPAGCLPLDASAIDALEEVILPPLPADFPRDREVIHARFLAVGPVQGLRPTLRAFKARGYF